VKALLDKAEHALTTYAECPPKDRRVAAPAKAEPAWPTPDTPRQEIPPTSVEPEQPTSEPAYAAQLAEVIQLGIFDARAACRSR
jgi:hypothetical protein